jgi:hypothetical protein
MDDSTALVSLAMLKVDSDIQGRDYLDYLVPFVVYVLAKYKPDPVTSNETQRLLREEFKLRIPVYPAELVLRRLAKRKYLTKEHYIYKPSKPIPAGSIDTLREDAKARTESVIAAVRDFAKSVHSVDWSEDEANSALAAYLTHFSVDCLRCYSQKTALPEIKPSHEQKSVFIVNTLAVYLKEKFPSVFENLIVLVKGQLLANALICSDLESIPRKFDSVTFYLDTPVLLQLFGLEGKPLETTACELIELLRNLKGTIAAFDHTVEEVHGVIEACERNLDNPHAKGLVITEMRRAGKTPSDISLIKARLPELYKQLNISKRTTPGYIASFQIDEKLLHAALAEELSYGNPRAADYDVASIRSIYSLRRGKEPHRLEDAGAVLVTSNAALARVAYEYGKEHEASPEVSAVITSFSLANMAWLKAPLGAPDLPRLEIIAICYAAMNPPDALWSAYLSEIDKLRKIGDISPRDHELLRFSLKARDELMNLTLGSEEAFSDKTVSQILQRVQVEIGAEKDLIIKQQRAEHQARAAEMATEIAITKGKLEEEIAKTVGIGKRLFWISDRISGFLTICALVVVAVVILTGSFLSNSLVGSYFLSHWIYVAIAFAAWLTIAWGVFHLFFGLSVKDVGRKARAYIQNVLYRSLCKVFSVEPDPHN